MTAALVYLSRPGGAFLALLPPTPPEDPTSLDAVATSTTNIRITWTDGERATAHVLQVSSDGENFSDLANPATSPHNHNVGVGAHRYYRVRGTNGAGNSNWAGPVSATTDPAALIEAQHSNGQTFISRTDVTADATKRYRLYRHTAAITDANLASATVVQRYLAFNSSQVFGGKPNTLGGQIFNQTNRLDSSANQCKLPDGEVLNYGDVLAVHTCLVTGNYYYALVETDASDNVTETITSGVNSLAFAVSETALATTYPVPVLWASGAVGSGRGTSSLRITGTTGLPVKLTLHASSAGGGAPGSNTEGDYWQFFGDEGCGYQDGMQTAWSVLEYQTPNPNQLWATTRDTMWTSPWTGSFETVHIGAGFIKPGWAGPRFRAWQHRRLLAFISWLISHYGADANRITLLGQSMGAWGVAAFAYRYPQYFACLQSTFTNFRFYTRSPAAWPVVVKNTPFGVDLLTNPLGTDPAAVLMDDGVTAWGGVGGYTDAVTLIANATTDLPMHICALGRQDGYSAFQQFIDGLNALRDAKQPYAAFWTDGGHDSAKIGLEYLLSVGAPVTSKAWATYKADTTQFRRDQSYPAFSNASHDDDPAVHTVGGRNVGFRWGTDSGATNNSVTDSAGTWSAYIDNIYMDVTPAASWNAGTGTLTEGGPQGGPYSQITVDVTPVFRQSFLPSVGATVNYSYTPFGSAAVTGSVTVDSNGRITVPMLIKDTGPTFLSLT